MEVLEYFQGRQAFRRLGFVDFAYKDLLGSTNAALLLTQIEYWFVKSGGDFYKFRSPCGHKMYKQGDSWCEELHLSEKELRNAISKLKELELITTKTTIDRLTTWHFNAEKVFKYLTDYEQKQHLDKSQNSIYEKAQTEVTKKPKGQLLNSQKDHYEKGEKAICSITKNTTKPTTKNTQKACGDFMPNIENDFGFAYFELDKIQTDLNLWLEYIQHRKKNKQPLTLRALKAQAKKLTDFYSQGFTANECLELTLNSGTWKEIYAPKAKQSAVKNNADDNILERIRANNEKHLAEINARLEKAAEEHGLDAEMLKHYDPAKYRNDDF